VIDRAEEHLGTDRAGRYLRKFYPWYAERLEIAKPLHQALVTAHDTGSARVVLSEIAGASELVAAA